MNYKKNMAILQKIYCVLQQNWKTRIMEKNISRFLNGLQKILEIL
jgi:hypothetical protein